MSKINSADLVSRVQIYEGKIPEIIPAIREDERIFAGGNIVLAEILKTLQSKDLSRVYAWSANFDLSDSCLLFEDEFKVTLSSPFLTGIVGTVFEDGSHYIGVDAKVVKRGVIEDGMKQFKVRKDVLVMYMTTKGGPETKLLSNVVLLPCDYQGGGVSFTPEQYKVIKGKIIKKSELKPGKKLSQEEIVNKQGKVIHALLSLYNPKIIVPLVREYGYDKNMRFDNWVNDTHGKAILGYLSLNEIRMGGISNRSIGFVSTHGRLVGIIEKENKRVIQLYELPTVNLAPDYSHLVGF